MSINGIINIYKETGFTSHDVVAKLRGILKQKKIGHTGTLDPDAEGVLPVCLGNGTKLCDMLMDKDKTYQVVMKLGIITDTQDMSGSILERKNVCVTKQELQEAILSYVGEYDQIPPMYSALKVNGKKLYELAREGKVIERKARRIHIYSITIQKIDLENNQVFMEVECSKGTYIRTLCHDIGSKLGCGGCMESLIRTRVSCFDIKDSLTLSEIQKLVESDHIKEVVICVEDMFSGYPKMYVLETYDKYLYNGNYLEMNYVTLDKRDVSSNVIMCTKDSFPIQIENNQKFRIYDSLGCFLGIYTWIEESKRLKPMKMFL